MVKVCKLKNCPSGRRKTINATQSSQPLIFFRPTTVAKVKKWSTALGIKLKQTDSICHLHFKQEDIKMYQKFKDNVEDIFIPTGTNILRDEALPTIEHQFIPPVELEVSEFKQQYTNSDRNQFKEEEEQHQSEENIEQQWLIVDPDSPNNMMDDSEPNEPDLKEPLLDHQAYIKIENREKAETIATFEKIRNSIINSSILPQCWLYAKKLKGLEFMRIDPDNGQIKNRLRLNKDGSITVIFRNNEEYQSSEKINSLNSIYNYLISVEKWPLCVGTQINNNEYSETCKGVIIGEEAYKRNRQYTRCKSCRILRHTLQKRKRVWIPLYGPVP